MIRKPTADWGRADEGAAVRTVRTAAAVAKGGANVARRSGHAVRGLICYFFAAVWGFVAITSSFSLASLVGIGAMAAAIFWAGNRAFAKARLTSS